MININFIPERSVFKQVEIRRDVKVRKIVKIVILGKDNIFYYLIGRYGQGRPQKALITEDITCTCEGLYRKREAVPECIQNNAVQCRPRT